MMYSRSFFCITLVTGLFVIQTAVDAKMYRWVDANGRTVYSDKVPATQSKLERNVLNQKGRVVDTVKAAKTKEQIALEKRLKLLRKEQEKIIARQKSNDKVLLSTFRNIDDLRMTLNGKLLAVDAHMRVHESNLENLKENLDNTQKKAAQEERSGRNVSVTILNEITVIEKKIELVHSDKKKTAQKRVAIQRKFDIDIERFLFLTRGSDISAQARSDETAELKAADTLGLYNCKDRTNCLPAWEIAKQFVIDNSTTPINFNTDSLIMGSDPMVASDLSLSVSKSQRKNGKVSIFLDIRCHNSSLGNEFCQSDKVKKLRSSFRPHIESQLEN